MKVQDNSLNLGQVLLNQTNTDDGRFCDVILQVENKDFHAHRSVLASRCEYFNTMFTVNMKEKHDKVITMQGITANVFNEIMNWIYIGKATITADDVINLYRACSMMQINQLLDHVKQFLVGNIEELLLNNQDLELTFDEMKEIMESNQIGDLNQQTVFDCILKWINQNVEERKSNFPDLFQLVRLDLVSSDYLYNVISKNEVFKQFSESRDRLEEALFIKNTNTVKAESSTSLLSSRNKIPDALVAFSSSRKYTDVINIETKKLTRYHKCLSHGLKYRLNGFCSIALKYPWIALCEDNSPSSSIGNNINIFNGSEWRNMTNLNKPRAGCASTFFDEDLYVFGGETSSRIDRHKYRYNICGDGEMLNYGFECNQKPSSELGFCLGIQTTKWKNLDLGLKPRSYLAAQTVDNKIYLIGGFTYKRGCDNLMDLKISDENKVPCADTTIYCPHTRSSIEGSKMKKPRAAFACATLDSTIYVCGGIGFCGSNLSCIEYLDTTTNVWINAIQNVDYLCYLSEFPSFPVTSQNSPASGMMFHGCFVKKKLYFVNSSKVFVYDLNSNSISLVCEINVLIDPREDRVIMFPFSQSKLPSFFLTAPPKILFSSGSLF